MTHYLMGGTTLGYIIDGFIVFLIVSLILSFILRTKKAISIFICLIILGGLYALAYNFEWKASELLIGIVIFYLPFFAIVLLAPELKKYMDTFKRSDSKDGELINSSENTKRSIVEAIEYLSLRKIGAIVTLEKYNSLDQYSERAIRMNSDVSKELLINIFIPNTPLHDGAVIIRGNKIRCAGAYYVLTQAETSDKTMGSRHRAALGISEISDSLTIVASEETGKISIAIEGIMISISDKEKLLEYIEMFMR